MTFAPARTFLVLLGLVAAVGAQAQSPLTPSLPAPTLEPTIKVQPAPQIQRPAQPAAAQCVCTMQHDPVCARTRDGRQATYTNACRARCEGATEIKPGSC